MKKLFFLIVLSGFLTYAMTSCGGKQDNNESAETEDGYGAYESAEDGSSESGGAGGTQQQGSAEDLIKQGQALLAQSDCRTCHHDTNKLIGPAYSEVAKKYEFTQANVTYLAGKIINGGSGVWGEIPMTPHVGMSEADAEKMAMYVLSLDGEEPKL